jgi:hypothetical protein
LCGSWSGEFHAIASDVLERCHARKAVVQYPFPRVVVDPEIRGALAWPGLPPHKPGSGQLPDVGGKRGSTGSDSFGNLPADCSAGSKNAQVATLTENMARLGHKTVGAALRYQHSRDGRDAIVAASLSANAIAELTAVAEQIDADETARAQ